MTHLKKWLYTGRFSKFSSLSPVINQFHKSLNVLHVTKRREQRKCTIPSNLTVTPKCSPTSLGLSCWVVWESWDSATYWFFCYSFNSWDANISTFIGFGIFWYLLFLGSKHLKLSFTSLDNHGVWHLLLNLYKNILSPISSHIMILIHL